VFEALGRNNVNVAAIAQGASERNISFVVDSAQRTRALNVVHEAFFETRKKLAVMLIGVGNIGSALLRQLEQQRSYLSGCGYDIRVCCVANSRRYVLDAGGIDLSRWREALNRSRSRTHPRRLADEIGRLELTNAVLVDCTASTEIAAAYPEFVNANLHIITPNKKANVLPWKQYAALTELMRQRRKHFLYEANVGAGLPIISTLGDLIASGDRILKVEGIFSGTLSYLFNHFDGTKPFSAVLRDAHALGLTEPDPRDDLSGEDVARKLLIVARHLGLQLEIEDVTFENLVPAPLRKGAYSPSWFDRFARVDAAMQERLDDARSRGYVLRYVGVLEGQTGTAGLRGFPPTHPFAGTKGSDNIIAITTERYARTPLVIQGPGAGADVTAMGVFSDILKLLHYLP
jgi:aspartokinase/homoserine dehydrogenase 1